ncbi:MAG: signal peptidase II [Legionellaceae bacterium]|nr:signal peptidase II [Legionellaceae bacterium]
MKKLPFFLLSLVIISIDQLSKVYVSNVLVPYSPENVLPFLNFIVVYNTGSAFSFLSDAGEWHQRFFTVFSLIMSIAITVWIIRVPAMQKRMLFSLSLILGGALGNLIDRVLFGHVVDFIDMYYKSYHWPVFNLADSAITVGALLLFLSLNRSESVV